MCKILIEFSGGLTQSFESGLRPAENGSGSDASDKSDPGPNEKFQLPNFFSLKIYGSKLLKKSNAGKYLF